MNSSPNGDDPSLQSLDDFLVRMPVADKVGQLIMAYLEPEALEEKVARYRCGSLLVWGNLKGIDASGLCQLANRAQAVSLERRGRALWLHGWSPGLGWRPDWLGHAARASGTEEAERVAAIFGRRWRAVGLHNLPEPCLNVPLHETGIMLAWTVSRDPGVVRRYGVALTRGATSARCGTMAQHFPAHGATPLDSHSACPVVTLDRETLLRDHLECYRACFEAGCRTICTAHLACPALDPDPGHIATTSRPILTDFLRGELGFNGVTIADAIGMYGFRKNGPPEGVRFHLHHERGSGPGAPGFRQPDAGRGRGEDLRRPTGRGRGEASAVPGLARASGGRGHRLPGGSGTSPSG